MRARWFYSNSVDPLAPKGPGTAYPWSDSAFGVGSTNAMDRTAAIELRTFLHRATLTLNISINLSGTDLASPFHDWEATASGTFAIVFEANVDGAEGGIFAGVGLIPSLIDGEIDNTDADFYDATTNTHYPANVTAANIASSILFAGAGLANGVLHKAFSFSRDFRLIMSAPADSLSMPFSENISAKSVNPGGAYVELPDKISFSYNAASSYPTLPLYVFPAEVSMPFSSIDLNNGGNEFPMTGTCTISVASVLIEGVTYFPFGFNPEIRDELTVLNRLYDDSGNALYPIQDIIARSLIAI